MATTPWVAGLYVELVSIPVPAPRQLSAQALGEEDRAVLPPLAPGAENFYTDLFAYKTFDARAWLQQLLDEDTRREFLPIAPNVFDDWDWSAWFSAAPQKIGNETEWSTFTPPALPPPLNLGWDEFSWNRAFGESVGWRGASAGEESLTLLPAAPNAFDEFDWNRAFGESAARATSIDDAIAILVSAPFVPDDFDAMRAWGAQGLAGLLAFDEFVNAPSSGTVSGAAPKGRSTRFGFSISSFR